MTQTIHFRHRSSKSYKTHGQHLLLDLWDCDVEILTDAPRLERLLCEAARAAGATVLKSVSEQFWNPKNSDDRAGATAIALLAESHISIHTYPERGFAALDIYTCGSHCDPTVAATFIREMLQPYVVMIGECARGDTSGGPPALEVVQ